MGTRYFTPGKEWDSNHLRSGPWLGCDRQSRWFGYWCWRRTRRGPPISRCLQATGALYRSRFGSRGELERGCTFWWPKGMDWIDAAGLFHGAASQGRGCVVHALDSAQLERQMLFADTPKLGSGIKERSECCALWVLATGKSSHEADAEAELWTKKKPSELYLLRIGNVVSENPPFHNTQDRWIKP